MRINKCIQFIHQEIDLKTMWKLCCWGTKINLSMFNVNLTMSNKFVYQKQRIKKKISFVRTVYKCFSNALILTNLRDVCLEIKDKQVVKIS